MKFYKLIKEILNSLRMEKAEFQRLTGINPVNITWWEQHPDTLPQMKTIKRIEQGLGIVFEFDEEGRPTGWQRSDGMTMTESGPSAAAPGKESVFAAPSTAKAIQAGIAAATVPATPAELYDQFDVYGEKKQWAELSAQDRKYYENLYQLFLLEVEQANSSYERAVDQAAVARAHAIEDSKQKVRRAMLNHMMGEMKFSADIPF